MPFDYDAHTNHLLNEHLDSFDLEPCDECGTFDGCDCHEPDPDRFRDEDPNEYDREDY